MIKVGTTVISMDEPCFNLVELNLPAPNSRGHRRYQVLTVVRGDKLAEFRIDMGLAKDFKAEPLQVLGGVTANGKIYIEHTVGELLDIASWLRDRYHDKSNLTRTDLVGRFNRYQEAKYDIEKKLIGNKGRYY